MPRTDAIPERMQALQCAVLIPTYNNAGTIARVIAGVQHHCRDVIVVNDGSTDGTAAILAPDRRDIGNRLRTQPRQRIRPAHGAPRSDPAGIPLSADDRRRRQHYPDDIPLFVEAAERRPTRCSSAARNLTARTCPRRIPSPTSSPISGTKWKRDRRFPTPSRDSGSTRSPD